MLLNAKILTPIPFAWNTFFHSFAIIQNLFFKAKCVSWRQKQNGFFFSSDLGTKTLKSCYLKVCNNSCHFVDHVASGVSLILICLTTVIPPFFPTGHKCVYHFLQSEKFCPISSAELA